MYKLEQKQILLPLLDGVLRRYSLSMTDNSMVLSKLKHLLVSQPRGYHDVLYSSGQQISNFFTNIGSAYSLYILDLEGHEDSFHLHS